MRIDRSRLAPLILISFLPLVVIIFSLIFAGTKSSLISPAPITVVVPMLLGSGIGQIFFPAWLLAPILPPLVFLFFSWQVTHEKLGKTIPLKIPIAMALVNILSVAYYANGWHDGVQYEGLPVVVGFLIESLLFVVSFWAIWA